MKKTWLVFWHEYTRHVLRRRFLFAVLSIPLFFVVIMAASIFASLRLVDNSPVGYVDLAGFIKTGQSERSGPALFNRQVAFTAFRSETEARSALDSKAIQAYFVLPAGYPQDASVRLVSYKSPSQQIQAQFESLLRANLLAGMPAGVAQRVLVGSTVVVQSADGSREAASSDWLALVIPILSGILLMVVILTTGGYLVQALVEERENRTIEILITSLSPDQLMVGKTLGNLAVGLTQLLIWLLLALAAVGLGISQMAQFKFTVGPHYLLILALTMLPAFLLIAGLMAAVGSTLPEAREAQQISGLFSLPLAVPLWFSYAIISNPNGPLAVGLSFFPLTAPVALPLRAGFAQIPPLQLAAIFAVLYLCAAGALWLAGRAFRLSALTYGKGISLRQVFRRA